MPSLARYLVPFGGNEHNVKTDPSKEAAVPNNKNPNQKQPGEKEPGKYHYNPGNMSGKTIDTCKDESEQRANTDRIRDRNERVGRRDA
jgi:hypothetical protein